MKKRNDLPFDSTVDKRAPRFVVAALVAATLGCAPSDRPSSPDENNSAPVETSASVEPNDEDKTAVKTAPKAHKSESIDAARILGEATSRFSQTFSDEQDSSANGENAAIDMSLVDEETRRQFTEDRAQVAPTLEQGNDEQKERYRLEYRFEPNTNFTWNVSHNVRKRISYGGRETLIETSSTTYRRWEFLDPTADGKVAARHWIDRMILRQNEEGKEPIDYDSDRDIVAPREISAFGTEKAVGVVLETFEIDPFGVMSNKTKLVAEYQGREEDTTVLVPLPKEAIGIGDVWTVPYALYLKGTDKVTRPYRVVERFQLEDINDRFATITFKTTLVSIVDDPVVLGELAERLFTGKALFDRELGVTTRTELDFNRSVTGAFGFSSFLDYNCQVVEKLERDESGAPLRTPVSQKSALPSEGTSSEGAEDSAAPTSETVANSEQTSEATPSETNENVPEQEGTAIDETKTAE